ncbi:MAG: dihydroorotase family protein [Candidatus Micrarchaeota archaeon]
MFIRSRRVFIDGKLRPACISIHSGKIGGIHSYTFMADSALDAGDWFVLPAAIDAHVHMREPEAPQKEDFTTGSMAALMGGVTSFLDMPCYRNPPTTTVGALTQKERLASTKSVADFGFHFGASADNDELIRRLQPPSVKAFLSETKSPLTLIGPALERHFSSYDPCKPLCVHCEDALMAESRALKLKGKTHEEINSIDVALSAVRKVAAMTRKYRRRVHFCHLTSAAEVNAAKSAAGRKDLPPVTLEVAPHHLFLSIEDLPRLGENGRVNPPLRSRREVAKLWKVLKKVDLISSDHAPHLPDEKKGGAPGFPGVQTMFPLLLHAVVGGKLKIEEAVRMACTGPADAFTLHRKGRIVVGNDADLVIFNPADSWTVALADLRSKAGWSPYEGWRLRGKILGVFLRGEQVVWDNDVLVKPGFGKPLQRTDSVGQTRLDLRRHAKERQI